MTQIIIIIKHVFLFIHSHMLCLLYTEPIEPKFPYRDVTIKRGVDAKDTYDMITEIGRYVFHIFLFLFVYLFT